MVILATSINLLLSFQIYKQRRQNEQEEQAHQPPSQFNNQVPKSLESMLINVSTSILIAMSTGMVICSLF